MCIHFLYRIRWAFNKTFAKFNIFAYYLFERYLLDICVIEVAVSNWECEFKISIGKLCALCIYLSVARVYFQT